MPDCRKTEILSKLIPFKSWQYFLLHRHVAGCPACLENLASLEEARSVTGPKERLGEAKDFWPEFLSRVNQQMPRAKTKLRPRWRWAFGTLGLAILLAAGILLLTRFPQKEIPALVVKLKINYIQIYDSPAQAIIFQTQDASKTFVWVENPNQGDRQ
jgi:hypothetical protein